MNILSLHKLPRQIYRAFIHDGRRLYRLLPARSRLGFWVVFGAQFLLALVETSTLLIISFFAVSVSAPEAALNNSIARAALPLIPTLDAWLHEPRHLVIFSSALMTVFILFKISLSISSSRLSSRFAEGVSLHIGQETLRRYLNKDYYWHLSPASTAVIHKFEQRGQLSQFLVNLLLLYSNALCCLALFSGLFLAEPRLTPILAATFGLGSLMVYLFLRRRLDAAGSKVRDLNIEESADRLTLLQGLREVFIYRRQDIIFRKMAARQAAGRPARAFLTFAAYMPSQILEFIGFSSISLLTIALLLRGAPMSDIVSSVSLLMLTAWRILPAVNRSLNYAVAIRSLRPSALSCLELLEIFISEAPKPSPGPDPDFRFEKSLALENAAFAYPGASAPALAGLNLELRQGERVGVVGLSGAGKSTLALLLTGLVRPQSGRFLVDGREISPAERAAYVGLVGFVPQNPLLLPGTLADNVAFSRWGETYDRQAAAAACRQAAMDFVFAHPQGLNRRLGAKGEGLSGGQAQRVAIARALFAAPEIIIFDEATSALDQASENLIAATIGRLPRRTTVIIIAHRLSSVENCDRLVWLEEGRTKDEGPPAEILPRYRAAMAEPEPESLAAVAGRP